MKDQSSPIADGANGATPACDKPSRKSRTSKAGRVDATATGEAPATDQTQSSPTLSATTSAPTKPKAAARAKSPPPPKAGPLPTAAAPATVSGRSPQSPAQSPTDQPERAAATRSKQPAIDDDAPMPPPHAPALRASPKAGRQPPRRPPISAEFLASLRVLAELRGMDDETFREFVSHLWCRKVPPNTRIIVEGEEAQAVFFLLRGEVRTTIDERTMALRQAPTRLGLLSLIDGRRRTASIEAFSECDIAMLDKESFDHLIDSRPQMLHALIRQVTEELRQYQRSDDASRRSFDDHFHTPNARLIQGPYHMDDFSMTARWMETEESRIRACLPDGVRPLLGGRYLLTFNDFPKTFSEHPSAKGKSFAYRETTPFIPVLGPSGRPGVFSPELYLDSYMPIVLGRELYGFPKRFGVATFSEKSIDLQIGSNFVLRAAWSRATPTDFGGVMMAFQRALFPFPMPGQTQRLLTAIFQMLNRESVRKHWPSVPVFVHSILPEAHGDASDARIDELVEIPFIVQRVGAFEILEDVSVRPFEDWLLAGKALAGVRVRMAAGFGRAMRPVDYREESRLTTAHSFARTAATKAYSRVMRLLGH